MIASSSIHKSYGSHIVLDDLSFTIQTGEFVTLFGPNGCGKSTLMNILAGLDTNYTGSIQSDIALEGQIGFVFQDYRRSLMPWLSVAENILLPLQLRGVSPQDQQQKLNGLLERVKINFSLSQHVFTLSGGQAQMVSLLRALIIDPKILILDEPFSALDYERTLELRQTIMEVAKDFELTVLFISHDLDEALYLGDRVVFLTRKPTHIADILDVNFSRPRAIDVLGSSEFAALKLKALKLLHLNHD
jgi:NitT/TauT family transport system ATP-binding protein